MIRKINHLNHEENRGAIIACITVTYAVVNAMVAKMKYFIACLIMPIIPILLLAFFGMGALYFGVTSRFERMGQ
jgi:uncharacterized integral membrane protein